MVEDPFNLVCVIVKGANIEVKNCDLMPYAVGIQV
jgi:hypothetical protein